MLEAGADGTTLDYYPSLAGATILSMIVLTNKDAVTITPDPARHKSHGEWMAKLRVRMTSGDSLDAELT